MEAAEGDHAGCPRCAEFRLRAEEAERDRDETLRRVEEAHRLSGDRASEEEKDVGGDSPKTPHGGRFHVRFTSPEWLPTHCDGVEHIPSLEERMRFVIQASRRNIEEGTGGPFAAAVFERETGRLVSLGVNLVTTECLSILHAEMVAIAAAQRALGTFDLGAPGIGEHQLVTSTEPCAMCFGAIPWSGVKEVIAGATDADARAIGFDEGPKLPDWRAALRERGIEVRDSFLREEAKAVLDHYAHRGGVIY